MFWNLFSLIRSGASIWAILFLLLSFAALIFVMLPIHEFAHAFAADKLGDPTPRWNRRLTLNPKNHLDIFGTIMLILCGFGYAKPVPVNPANFKNPKRDLAITALCGPLSNILMAIISVAIFRLIVFITGSPFNISGGYISCESNLVFYAYIILIEVFASINLSLAVFNLLPIFPLDGAKIFAPIIPDKWIWKIEQYSNIITMILFVLLFMGVLTVPINFLRHLIGWLICTPMGLPNYF